MCYTEHHNANKISLQKVTYVDRWYHIGNPHEPLGSTRAFLFNERHHGGGGGEVVAPWPLLPTIP